MLRSLLQKFNKDEGGFTLIELLVVILIIGILAAIALPTFLGQQDKAKDASAKSDARNLVSQVESCYTTEQDYSKCDTMAEIGAPNGLNMVDGAPTQGGEVGITGATATGYVVTAKSKSNGNTDFVITKSTSGFARTCSQSGKGACPANGEW